MQNYNGLSLLKQVFLVPTIATLILVFSCDTKQSKTTEKNIKKLSRVSLQPIFSDLKKLTWGDTIGYSISSSIDSLSIDSVFVLMNRKLLLATSDVDFEIDTRSIVVGKHKIIIQVKLSNGIKESHEGALFIQSDVTPTELTFKKIRKFPHDPDAFTQGLLFDEGRLLESTGLNGTSSIRIVDLSSGEVKKKVDLSKDYFGEGITVFGDNIYQLTWHSRKGFIYDKYSLTQVDSFDYPTKGWGITTVDSVLVMSDGTNLLYLLDPLTLTRKSIVQVYSKEKPIYELNELEYFNGKIYANIWRTEEIVSIDVKTGRVMEHIDLSGIFNYDNYERRIDVLNGIAYDPDSKKVYVTGKYWPKLFEVEFVPTPL